MGILSALQPEKVFGLFETLSSVPHGSGNTKGVSDLCVGIARDAGFEAIQDEYNNVIIRKPASPGYEDHPPVVLQAHLDMVCAAADGSGIDMSKEPLRLATDGKYVWAEGTSLGGDDMIGVACALALLDEKDAPHPPLEILLTADEETGMDGAIGLDPSLVTGRRMLNLDSEEIGVVTAGCAGGMTALSEIPVTRKPVPEGSLFLKITISGLQGGHSGEDIDKERENAILLLGGLILKLRSLGPRICSFEAGVFDNVIPSSAVCTVAFPSRKAGRAKDALDELASDMRELYSQNEPGIRVCAEETDPCTDALTAADTEKICRLLYLLPNGVRHFSTLLPGLVDTSVSTGVARLEDGRFRFRSLIRSSSKMRKYELWHRIRESVEAAGGTCGIEGEYPGWQFNKDSRMLALTVAAYRELTGKRMKVFATHGGLECGILSDKLEGLDCVSIGPELSGIHSPAERLGVASVGELYRLLLAILKKC